MKVKITAHIHYHKYSWVDKGSFEVYTYKFDDTDNRTYVGEQEIEVDRPRPPTLVAGPMQGVLDRGEHLQHVVRRQVGLDQAGSVQENVLSGGAADRPGIAVATHAHERDARHESQQLHRAVEIITPFPDV
jgi:hypothetical protein